MEHNTDRSQEPMRARDILSLTIFCIVVVASVLLINNDRFDCASGETQDEFGQCIAMDDFIRYTSIPGLELNEDGESVTVDCSLQTCIDPRGWMPAATPAPLEVDCARLHCEAADVR